MQEPLQIQIDLNQTQPFDKPVQIQSWVNTAINAKINGEEEKQTSQPSQMLQLNMTFSQSILNQRS